MVELEHHARLEMPPCTGHVASSRTTRLTPKGKSAAPRRAGAGSGAMVCCGTNIIAGREAGRHAKRTNLGPSVSRAHHVVVGPSTQTTVAPGGHGARGRARGRWERQGGVGVRLGFTGKSRLLLQLARVLVSDWVPCSARPRGPCLEVNVLEVNVLEVSVHEPWPKAPTLERGVP